MKRKVKLKESNLRKIIKESVSKILYEMNIPKDTEKQLAWSEDDFYNNRDKENLDWMMNRDEWDAEQGKPSPFNRNIYPSNKTRREVRNQSGRLPYKWKNESLNRIVRESINRVLRRPYSTSVNEVWDIDDKGIIDFDEFGNAKNRSYTDKHDVSRKPSDVYDTLNHTPYKDERAITNYKHRDYEYNPFAVDSTNDKYIRPSDWYVRGCDMDENL